ncbi:NAD-dependent succinate-semialdehyde dehydrogenase [Alkalibacillus haloalkaliphilus]|uniref:NAD-dependent succinate-semialdehyde dehydrogenase n=1 Tax=Alkalibacillus haloalkaliphilus TaxID=94136 RepID=UPI002935B28D|nr:NAD-dependent succinate-semialdehyde dehydrogenase [Alkalibacillus haloalkaliphilus]MDV2582180.1 NAD-dependent succinate-semialdehyde dehydrogenase [Alkalibacillus haloalkaliphilus]
MLYINGEWVNAASGDELEVINPANGELIQKVAKGDEQDSKLAIEAADSSFKSWKSKTAQERAKYLRDAATYLKENIDQIAETVTKEMGKPFNESKGEIVLSINYFEWYAEEAKRVYGETIPASHQDKRLMVIKEPVGVTAAVTPWNFPVAMIARKIAPALAAGCPVVVKPASATPLSAIKVFEALHAVGLPKGVANLISGSASKVVGEMTRNELVRKITFTGSTEVGKKLIRDSAETVKKVSMELGGHAPYVVFEDADLDQAVEGAVGSKFRNAGQTCICTNRIYVQESVAEEFSQKFAEKVSQLKIGNGLDEGVAIGPIIDEDAYEKVKSQISDATNRGATVVCGGQKAEVDGQDGWFFEPTVLKDVTDDMVISTEETFGPVAPVYTFKTKEEAVERANHPEYGLAAYCYTNDLKKAYYMMEELEYGIVGINDPIPTTAQAPFGGVKESGIGREGGHHGIEEYLEDKFVSINVK